ncbi:NAD(P)H-dependent oxidoreductase [Oceanobacillus salinisoli]|uniref:NAD(P)H-dependent oxidoreductase n=1 Tax=Oceanobacillus salinisoli TaxID=2678611 RepID=UPI0012E15888|nr:NAD(P)H-dependent oxidoreductase [Oceanobacillus salinisoli]
MNILIVYAHPEPNSFTGALKDKSVEVLEKEGHHVEVSDLYKDNFKPTAGRDDFHTVFNQDRFHYQAEQEYACEQDGFINEIKHQQKRLQKADLLIMCFPLWWGGMPAILKGWVDRVLAYGFAYVDGHRYNTGLFRGRRGILCISTGGTKQRFSEISEGGTYGEIDRVLYPLNHCIIKYFGMEQLNPYIAYAAPRLQEKERKGLLEKWEERLIEITRDKEWERNLKEWKEKEVKINNVPRGWERK